MKSMKSLLHGLVVAAALSFGADRALAQGHEQAAQAEPAAGALQQDSGLDSGQGSNPAGAPAPLAGMGTTHEPSSAGHEAHGATTSEGQHGTPHGEGHAAGHGEHAGFSASTFALQLLNFGVLLFLLIWFGGRAMNKSLRTRHEQLKADISDAARLRDEATKKFEAQEKRVRDLEKEIAALRTSMHQDAEREQARLLESAQERAKRISDDVRFQLDQQVKTAELLLRAEVASAAVKLAEELVRKAVNTDDERRLAQDFVAGFAKIDSPDGPAGPAGPERIVR